MGDDHTYNDGDRHFAHPHPDGFLPGGGVGVYTTSDVTYRNGARRFRVAARRPPAVDEAPVTRLYTADDEEVVPTAEIIMPVIRCIEDEVGATPATTNELLITVLGAYYDHVGGTRPSNIEDCLDIINSLVQDEVPRTAVNLLPRQLQSDCRDLNESVTELVRVENVNEAALTAARQKDRKEIAA